MKNSNVSIIAMADAAVQRLTEGLCDVLMHSIGASRVEVAFLPAAGQSVAC